jgi:hypothetical protein
MSEPRAVAVTGGPPFDCECSDMCGGEVGVLGWTTGFVWSVGLAAW